MAQSLASILIHIIFSTKTRRPFIQPPIIRDLHCYMANIVRAYGCHAFEIGGVENHVHLLVSLPRTLPLSKLIEEVKKGSSKWIKTNGEFYLDFAWQNGYGAFSIGQSGFPALQKYIQNQKEHHKTLTFQDEYREFLKKYEIEFDEKYVWD